METYEEYPIRCKTCNEQLSCYAPTYKELLNSGLSIEEALNQLGITDACSRIAMMNPTIVAFNMENREVIEGFKSVDAANEADAQNESQSRPVFNPCMGAINAGPVGTTVQPAPLLRGLVGVQQQRVQPNVPGVVTQQIPPIKPLVPGMQTIGLVQAAVKPVVQTVVQPLGQPVQTVVQPLAQPTQLTTPPVFGVDLGTELGKDIIPVGVGIPVKGAEEMATKKFQEPTTVGIPTVNDDPTIQQMTVYVGAGKQVQVLNGRTYLAQ